jgi:hypothetical protein
VKYVFENIRKGVLLKSSYNVAAKIEDKKDFLEGKFSDLVDIRFWKIISAEFKNIIISPLAPSDPYMGRTAQLTFRGFILNTCSTNIRTEYFKRAA